MWYMLCVLVLHTTRVIIKNCFLLSLINDERGFFFWYVLPANLVTLWSKWDRLDLSLLTVDSMLMWLQAEYVVNNLLFILRNEKYNSYQKVVRCCSNNFYMPIWISSYLVFFSDNKIPRFTWKSHSFSYRYYVLASGERISVFQPHLYLLIRARFVFQNYKIYRRDLLNCFQSHSLLTFGQDVFILRMLSLLSQWME